MTGELPRASSVCCLGARLAANLRGFTSATGVAVDDDHVYFNNDQGMYRVPKKGIRQNSPGVGLALSRKIPTLTIGVRRHPLASRKEDTANIRGCQSPPREGRVGGYLTDEGKFVIARCSSHATSLAVSNTDAFSAYGGDPAPKRSYFGRIVRVPKAEFHADPLR